jgi:hypothetical protein
MSAHARKIGGIPAGAGVVRKGMPRTWAFLMSSQSTLAFVSSWRTLARLRVDFKGAESFVEVVGVSARPNDL